MELKVIEKDAQNRIDKYVSENTELTRSTAQRMIDNGNILVNRQKN